MTKDSDTHYSLGVALSGGGARGFAHAGALMAIEEAGLRPDVVAGVSAGSVAAVLYAGGLTPLSIANLFAKTSFRDFTELNLTGGGIFRLDRFGDFICRALGGVKRIEDLKIPTYIGATDLDNGYSVAFHRGELAPRVVASCSIPIVFKPVKIDGTNFVDGGVLRNHPAWILRPRCQTLIGINVSPLKSRNNYNSLIGVALRTYNLMAKANQSDDMALCDVSVEATEIAHYPVFDLRHIKDIFVSGYKSTRQALIQAGMWKTASTTITV